MLKGRDYISIDLQMPLEGPLALLQYLRQQKLVKEEREQQMRQALNQALAVLPESFVSLAKSLGASGGPTNLPKKPPESG